MGARGTLTKANLGFSMPVLAPLYPSPPFHYKDAELITFTYETDAKLAAAMLPEALSLPDRATAGFAFALYPWSSLGPYREVVQYLDCIDDGEPKKFATALYVTSDAAMASGREAAGFPKKIAEIEIQRGVAYTASIDRPAGLRLASGVMRPETPIPATGPPPPIKYLTLRVIPSPLAGAAPSLCELVETHWQVTSGEVWTGTGSFLYSAASALDPLHALPMVHPGPCLYMKGDLTVSNTPAGGIRPL